MKHEISEGMLAIFRKKMMEEEKAAATVEKYTRDVGAFLKYAEGSGGVDKERVLTYKSSPAEKYTPVSVNSMLAALNCFFKKTGWFDCTVKLLKIQKESFRAQEQELSKSEYLRLLGAAKDQKNERMYLVMETICSTGIRVSGLKFITVEALESGRAQVALKGKTRTGKPMDRSNICHAMKALCEKARVAKEKVFPHNLRRLFACTFYKVKKDLSRLADVLGHSNVNTTRIYTLVSGKTQMKQIESLGLVT